ncbi:unnamed protein product [Hymenolepis diminuta]|uniref:Uncharacterized protein n=1 Tax=Hymenolepis diminuta TaxID=6216 RepID=A0A564XYZ3_HYMDI|nr:unnamed protein product [Hymenolepis diminuta]
MSISQTILWIREVMREIKQKQDYQQLQTLLLQPPWMTRSQLCENRVLLGVIEVIID